MTLADTYLVFFAAVNTADMLFAIWLGGTIVVYGAMHYQGDKLSNSISTLVLLVYSLFAIPLIVRWVIALNKIIEFADLLREQGEAMPPAQVSAVIGFGSLLFVILLTLFTLRQIWSRRRKVRVI